MSPQQGTDDSAVIWQQTAKNTYRISQKGLTKLKIHQFINYNKDKIKVIFYTTPHKFCIK